MSGDGAELRDALARRIAEFDPAALLALLAHMKYRSEEIFFESSTRAVSQPALCERIEFRSAPFRQVIVTVNLGLLGTQSPLPSYFKRFFEDAKIDDEAFLAFIRFFDHRLIENYLKSIYPERDAGVFPDFERTKESFVHLLGLRSISTFQWLLELVFPELGVKVERGTLTRNVQLEGARLGDCELGGGAVLGGWTRAPLPGFFVTLYCDEERTEQGRPWAEEVRRRLDSLVFPAVAVAALELRVVLVIRSERVWAQLRRGSYLGFDRMKGGARKNREVQIFKGRVAPR